MKYKLNGREVTKEEFDAAGSKGDDWLQSKSFVPNTYRGHDPLVSDGLGVMKSQVAETREEIRKRNIQGVLVRDNGQLEITSRRGRREFMRMRGLADADAGYGD